MINNKSVSFLLAFLFFSAWAFAQPTQSSAELKKKQADIQREIDELRKSLDETKKDKKQSLGELVLVQKKLKLREAQIETINNQVNLIQGNINKSWRDITKLRGEVDTLKEQYAKSVQYAYMNRSNYDLLNFIFSATNFNDALHRLAYIRSYRAYREQQVANIYNTQKQLQRTIEELDQSKKEKSSTLEEQNKQRAILEEDKKEKDAVVAKLKTRENELSKDLNDKRKQDASLKKTINTAIALEVAAARREAAKKEAARKEAEEKAKKEALAKAKAAEEAARKAEGATTPAAKEGAKPTEAPVVTTTPKTTPTPAKKPANNTVFDDPAAVVLSESFEKNKGNLPWPIASRNIVMSFGRQNYFGKIDYDNPGITISAPAKSAVKVVFDGEVTYVGTVGPVEIVIVKHGKYFTTYSNLSSTSVSKGQMVKTGQTVGSLAEKDDGLGELDFIITNERNVNLNPENWLR